MPGNLHAQAGGVDPPDPPDHLGAQVAQVRRRQQRDDDTCIRLARAVKAPAQRPRVANHDRVGHALAALFLRLRVGGAEAAQQLLARLPRLLLQFGTSVLGRHPPDPRQRFRCELRAHAGTARLEGQSARATEVGDVHLATAVVEITGGLLDRRRGGVLHERLDEALPPAEATASKRR
jgi:hypothetical protein